MKKFIKNIFLLKNYNGLVIFGMMIFSVGLEVKDIIRVTIGLLIVLIGLRFIRE